MENDKTVIRGKRYGQTQFTNIGQKTLKRTTRALTPKRIFESFIYLSKAAHVSFAISVTY